VKAHIGERAVLGCPILSEIKWTFKGGSLPGNVINIFVGTIILTQLKLNNTGEYACFAANEKGGGNTKYIVILQVYGKSIASLLYQEFVLY